MCDHSAAANLNSCEALGTHLVLIWCASHSVWWCVMPSASRRLVSTFSTILRRSTLASISAPSQRNSCTVSVSNRSISALRSVLQPNRQPTCTRASVCIYMYIHATKYVACNKSVALAVTTLRAQKRMRRRDVTSKSRMTTLWRRRGGARLATRDRRRL